MPIFYVNENLISEELQHTSTWQKTGEEYERWMIKTNGLERRTQDGSFERAERVICVHNLGKIPGDRTRVVATKFEGEEQYPAKVTVRTSSDTRYDTDVFIVAIPYDGIVMPTIDGDRLDIFKFAIVKSDRLSFQTNEDRKYRRCIYAVVAPAAHEVDNAGFYPSSCDLVIRTAVSNYTPQQGEPDPAKHHWTVRTQRVRFGVNGAYEIEYTDEVVDYNAIDPDELHKAKICTLVEPVILASRDNGNANRQNRPTAGSYIPNPSKMNTTQHQPTPQKKPIQNAPEEAAENGGKKKRRRRHKKSGVSGIAN